jgi:hypothetical protein
VSEYGFLALVLPVAWAVLALSALCRRDPSERNGWLVVTTGIALLLLCLYGAWYAAAGPLLRLLGCGVTIAGLPSHPVCFTENSSVLLSFLTHQA